MTRTRRGKTANAAEREQIKLDALPSHSVVLDANGHAWQTDGLYWYRAFGDSSTTGSWEMRAYAPFTVVHSPKT